MVSPSLPDSNDPIRPQLVPEPSRGPLRVIIEQPRGSWLGRVIKWGFVALVVVFLLGSYANYYDAGDSDIHERWHSLSKTAKDKIAVISVAGTIMGDEGYVKRQIDRVRDDEHVKAVVIRVDSPGGTVTGSDYIYHHLKKLAEDRQIPLVVSMGSIAASGGYYVAMAAGDHENVIFAEPTTWTGSIGVIIPHYDISGLLEKIDVQDDSIASNPMKMMGSPTRKFPEALRVEEQGILKGLVDSSFESFKEIVLASRAQLREDKSAQEVVFTGRIFTARQAQEQHLVDKLGFVEDAIERAVELAGLDADDVRVVRYDRVVGLVDQMLFGPQSRKPPIDLSALVELTTPKAYYMCTWMPGLAGGAR